MIPEAILKLLSKKKNYLKDLGIDLQPINENLLLESFIHKTYSADYVDNIVNNERLEFLGDSILGAIIAKLLFENFPNSEESKLTLYKIALVREETLAEVARDINLGDEIILGKGEKKSCGNDKNSILSDGLEALIGYIYLDFGETVTIEFINKYIFSKLESIEKSNVKPIKTILQEKLQKIYKLTPIYKDYELEYDDKKNVVVYKSEVYIEDSLLGIGTGSNKKTAQENAAKNALDKGKF